MHRGAAGRRPSPPAGFTQFIANKDKKNQLDVPAKEDNAVMAEGDITLKPIAIHALKDTGIDTTIGNNAPYINDVIVDKLSAQEIKTEVLSSVAPLDVPEPVILQDKQGVTGGIDGHADINGVMGDGLPVQDTKQDIITPNHDINGVMGDDLPVQEKNLPIAVHSE